MPSRPGRRTSQQTPVDDAQMAWEVDVEQEVSILLATYNGAGFLDEQLRSISVQTHAHWKIVVADDGSTDDTVEILERFARENPGKLELLFRDRVGSARGNFFRLIQHVAPSAYYAFCDQDDIWVPEKLAVLVNECRLLEERFTAVAPLLVYSDLSVVNENLKVVSSSFMQYIAAIPARTTLGSLLVENHIPGCAMLFNQALKQLLDSYDGSLDDITMHDWWVALIAAALGRIEFVDRSLVLYRQHSSNTLGVVNRRGVRFALAKLLASGDEVSRVRRQGALFAQAYGGRVSAPESELLRAFSSLEDGHWIRRALTSVRYGILKQTFARRVYQLMKS